MPKPTRREKTVVFGVPSLLGAALLVRMSTHGAVSLVALWVYLAGSTALLVWLWRRAGL